MNNSKKLIKEAYEKKLIKLINENGGNISSADEIWENINCLASSFSSFGDDVKYLKLSIKKMLAYIIDPGYRIEFSSTLGTDRSCTVEARLFWSGEEHPAGIGFSKRYVEQIMQKNMMAENERLSYLEATVRGLAASRAITDAGIGLDFYDDVFDMKFDEQEQDEATPKSVSQTTSGSSDTTSEKTGEEKPLVPRIPSATEKKASRAKKATAKEEPAPAPVEEKPAEQELETSTETTVATVEITPEPSTTATMDLETAKAAICDKGTYADNPLGVIYEVNPRNLIWLINNGSAVADAARVIVESDPELSAYLK